jgi:hypothetical protein
VNLGTVDWMVLFGTLLIFCAIGIFIYMAFNKRSRFDFAEMFEGEDGRTSLAKFLAFIGGLTGTWVVVAYAASKDLTDTMFSLYLGILVAGKVASEFVAARKSVDQQRANNGTPVADTTQPAGQVDITVPLSVKQSDVTVTPSERKVPLGKPKR